MKTKPKILFVSYDIPRPDRSSGELRTVRILEMLSKSWTIDLCIAISPYSEWDTSEDISLYIQKLSDIGINVLSIRRDTFYNAIKNNSYAGGYFNFYWVAEKTLDIFKLVQPNAFTIVDSVDIHYARMETQLKLGQIRSSKVQRTKKKEIGIYKKANAVIVVSKEDYTILKDDNDIKNVFLIPNIVNSSPRLPGKRKPYVLFIGSYNWYPNPAAVIWFAQEIWPTVHKSIPEAEFLVVGSDPSKEVIALSEQPGIKVVGFVPDTKPYLDMAAVSVAPLRIGGGMKGKVNEAMAHGVPVVATTIGAQGFEVAHGKQMMIADDPSEFSSCVISLLQDDKRQSEMGLAGQQLNAKICSVEAVEKKMEELVLHCSELRPQRQSNKTRKWLALFKMKWQLIIYLKMLALFHVIKDIGHGIALLRRDGITQFVRRTKMYLNGQRLDTIKPLETFATTGRSNTQRNKNAYPFVSVIIPNYNHARYLPQRISSVLNQTFQDFEVIILDDFSTDNSKDIIELYRSHPKVKHIIYNETNGGSVFKQWKKGIELAKGEFLWIAESDDFASEDFLNELVSVIRKDDRIGLCCSGSNWVDDNNMILWDWTVYKNDFIKPGHEEIKSNLFKHNSIPNASAVLLKKSLVQKHINSVVEYKWCGDWFLYIQILHDCHMAHVVKKLNSYRFYHNNSSSKFAKEGLGTTEGINALNFIDFRKTEFRLTDIIKVSFYWINKIRTTKNIKDKNKLYNVVVNFDLKYFKK